MDIKDDMVSSLWRKDAVKRSKLSISKDKNLHTADKNTPKEYCQNLPASGDKDRQLWSREKYISFTWQNMLHQLVFSSPP